MNCAECKYWAHYNCEDPIVFVDDKGAHCCRYKQGATKSESLTMERKMKEDVFVWTIESVPVPAYKHKVLEISHVDNGIFYVKVGLLTRLKMFVTSLRRKIFHRNKASD